MAKVKTENEKVEFPTQETLLIEALKALAIDNGVVSGPVAAGGNSLTDITKHWTPNILHNRLIKIIQGEGEGQLATIEANSSNSLIIKTTWQQRIDGTSVYVILGVDYLDLIGIALGAILSPLDIADEHNVVVVAAANILAADLVPVNPPCLFRLTAGFNAAGILSAVITRAGNVQVQHFNHGVVLTPDCLFMFDILVNAGDTVNYRYSVNATLQTLRVQEILAGTQ